MFLSRDQIEELNYNQCQAALRLVVTSYNLQTPIKEQRELVWPVLDSIINTVLELEDRIARYENASITTMNPSHVIVKPPVPAPKKKSGKRARQFRVMDVIYPNVYEAAKKTGIKVQTLKTYVSRKPDKYAYIDE